MERLTEPFPLAMTHDGFPVGSEATEVPKVAFGPGVAPLPVPLLLHFLFGPASMSERRS